MVAVFYPKWEIHPIYISPICKLYFTRLPELRGKFCLEGYFLRLYYHNGAHLIKSDMFLTKGGAWGHNVCIVQIPAAFQNFYAPQSGLWKTWHWMDISKNCCGHKCNRAMYHTSVRSLFKRCHSDGSILHKSGSTASIPDMRKENFSSLVFPDQPEAAERAALESSSEVSTSESDASYCRSFSLTWYFSILLCRRYSCFHSTFCSCSLLLQNSPCVYLKIFVITIFPKGNYF